MSFFQIIAYDRRRGGTIVIDKRETETVTSLIISQADQTDSGRYTCDPASSYPQSIMVHVTKGNIYRKPLLEARKISSDLTEFLLHKVLKIVNRSALQNPRIK